MTPGVIQRLVIRWSPLAAALEAAANCCCPVEAGGSRLIASPVARPNSPAGALTRRRLASMLLAAALLLPVLPAGAQSAGRYYPETGHTLDQRFLDFFDANGGVAVFGFPITDSFVEPQFQRLIQYTENARLEWHQDPTGHVELAPLGELIGGWQLPSDDAVDGGGCRFFPSSGHATCYAFLAFYDQHGGQDLFGVPISEFVIENDRIVQYFQFFRLDWFPEAPADEQVEVGPLGREHFRLQGYDPELLRPAGGSGQPYRVTNLLPSASVQLPSLAPEGTQDIYLVVRDQNQLPIAEAHPLLILHQPGRSRYFLMPPTDSQGLSRRAVTLPGVPANVTVDLEIWVIYQGLQAVTRDSFLVR